MASPEHTALSILQQLDDQAKVYKAQHAAFFEVGQVIEMYMKASKELETFEDHKRALEDSIARLQDRYDAQNGELLSQFQSQKRLIADEIEQLTSNRGAAQAEHNQVVAKLAATRGSAGEEIDKLAFSIAEKRAELAQLTTDLDTLKARHGLT